MRKLALSSFLMLSYVTQAYAGGDVPSDSHGGEHHEEASGGLPQLDPSSFESQTFWLVLIFIAIYLIFSRKSLPDISGVVENRAERIKNDLDSAAILKEEVEALQSSYEENLNTTREKSALLFKEVETDIKVKTDTHGKDFQEYALKKTSELEANIEKARLAAMDEMSDIAAEVAVEAAEKIIGVRTDAKSVRDVVKSLNKAA